MVHIKNLLKKWIMSAASEEVSHYVYDFIMVFSGNINPFKVEPFNKIIESCKKLERSTKNSGFIQAFRRWEPGQFRELLLQEAGHFLPALPLKWFISSTYASFFPSCSQVTLSLDFQQKYLIGFLPVLWVRCSYRVRYRLLGSGRQGLLIHWTALPRGTVSMTEEVGHSRCLVLNKSLTNSERELSCLAECSWKTL